MRGFNGELLPLLELPPPKTNVGTKSPNKSLEKECILPQIKSNPEKKLLVPHTKKGVVLAPRTRQRMGALRNQLEPQSMGWSTWREMGKNEGSEERSNGSKGGGKGSVLLQEGGCGGWVGGVVVCVSYSWNLFMVKFFNLRAAGNGAIGQLKLEPVSRHGWKIQF
jgi:hypothetical protein